jgi:hypothetical protein
VAQVQRGALEEVGDRARDVDRQRRAAAARQRRQGLADGQHAHLAGGGLDAGAAHGAARVAHQRREDDGRHDDDPVPARRELVDTRATNVLTS